MPSRPSAEIPRRETAPDASHTLSRLQCQACGTRWIGECLICPPACPSCGANALALIETPPLDEPWWHLLPRAGVV
jgi:hypothetical protein